VNNPAEIRDFLTTHRVMADRSALKVLIRS
jgi:hypothetical protein